jgi:uncharacterized protein (DUF302 family)
LHFADAVARVKDCLRDQGFGVLCEIDIAKTLKDKSGVDIEPYTIIGSCNPKFAHEALLLEPGIGLLLPCNVIVVQRDGQVEVAAVDARAMLSVTRNTSLEAVAAQVSVLLEAAIQAV